MTKKKISILILMAVFMFSMLCTTVTVSAASRLTDTSRAIIKITYGSDMAYCVAKFYGADGTTSITNGKMTLKDSKGTVVATWSGLSATGDSMSVTKTTTNIVKGEKYTLTASATANRNGSSETITGSASVIY